MRNKELFRGRRKAGRLVGLVLTLALADRVITEKPFESISQESYDKAVELMKKCQKVICPLKDFGTMNAANRELLRLARELGILAEL